MAQQISYSTTIRNNRLTQILNAIDAGAGAGLLRIYDGTRPSNGGTATTKLAEHTMSKPSFTVSGGVATAAAIGAATGLAAGTAAWARLVDSTGAFCSDMNVGTSGSDINVNTTTYSVGVSCTISSMTITEGNNYP